MKFHLRFFVGSLLFALCVSAFSKPEKKTDASTEINQLHVEMKYMSREIEAVRRDQLNYKIEKELLKEAYSSNIQTINIVITIILGVLGVLGYLGIRSVKEIRADYAVELDKLTTLKVQLERDIDLVRSKQKEVEGQVGNLTKTNEEQDRRLKIMELVEKVSNLMTNKQFNWALKYIDIGLGLDPKNTLLLSQKSSCHAKQGELTAAIESSKKILEIEPENVSEAFNLLEFLALAGQRDEFRSIYANYEDAVKKTRSGFLIVYLEALLSIMVGELATAKKLLHDFAVARSEDVQSYLDSWSFDEVRTITSKIPVGAQKALADAMISFLDGKMPRELFLKTLDAVVT